MNIFPKCYHTWLFFSDFWTLCVIEQINQSIDRNMFSNCFKYVWRLIDWLLPHFGIFPVTSGLRVLLNKSINQSIETCSVTVSNTFDNCFMVLFFVQICSFWQRATFFCFFFISGCVFVVDSSRIHPRYKEPVAQRLYAGAMSLVYNVPTPFQGPHPIALSFQGKSVVVNFAEGPISLRGNLSSAFEVRLFFFKPDDDDAL